MSRTSPTNEATPPIRWLPRASLSSSAPTSKSSRWTRITGSASGDRREERDLVAAPHRMVPADIFLVDRDPHHREVLQRLGEARPARLQPAEQRADRGHLGRRIDALLGDADPAAQPGEVQDFHQRRDGKRGRRVKASPLFLDGRGIRHASSLCNAAGLCKKAGAKGGMMKLAMLILAALLGAA